MRVGGLGLLGFSIGILICFYTNLSHEISLATLLASTFIPMWLFEKRRFIKNKKTIKQKITLSAIENRFAEALLKSSPFIIVALFFYFSAQHIFFIFIETLISNSIIIITIMIWIFIKPILYKDNEYITTKKVPWSILRNYLVKAFFLPLMIAFSSILLNNLESQFHAIQVKPTFIQWHILIISMLYLIDTIFATLGYAFDSKEANTFTRSSNPYLLGWASALIVYPPFLQWIQQLGFLKYQDNYTWNIWLSDTALPLVIWGMAIIFLTAIYATSTIVFGLRFSNLTNRGIITNGPYRYTKHPAYISKNLSWWLIYIPFIPNQDTSNIGLSCLGLLSINLIYYIRAKTEEKHLQADPKYRKYSKWIKKHGLIARTKQCLTH